MFHRLKNGALAAGVALGLLGGAPLAGARTPITPDAQTATPAIWSIEKPGGGTITLFGSVHLLRQDHAWRTPAFSDALAKADVVVFETPLEDAMKPEVGTYIANNSINPPGVTLSTLLKPDEKEIVSRAAGEIGVAFGMLEPMRPWFAALQISVGFMMKQGFDPNAGVDKTIEAEAKAAGKQLDYFETALEQLGFFTKLTTEQETAFLVLGAKQMLETPDEFQKLIDAWSRGDVAGLDALLNEGLAEQPELGKLLLEDRNARWVEKISSVYLRDDKNYLIIVGAGHLAGDESVQAMLRARGVAVAGP